MRICFVGDSFVAGTGDPECLGWVGRVCAAARRAGWDVTGYNLGVRRDTSADVGRRWEREVACRLPAQFPALVVFSFGNNDTVIEDGKPRVALQESIANVRGVLMAAGQRWPVLMIGPAPFPNEDKELRGRLASEYERVCAGLEVPYLDVFAAIGGSDIWRSEVQDGDGAHPGAGGYGLLARLVMRWPAWQAQLRRAPRL